MKHEFAPLQNSKNNQSMLSYNSKKICEKRLPAAFVTGFTLIEILIYIGLFTIMMGSGVIAAFYVIDSSEKTNRALAAETEAQFLIQKITWLLNETSIIHSPAPGTASTVLSADTYTVDAVSGRARIAESETPALDITERGVRVDNMIFTHLPATPFRSPLLQINFQIDGNNFTATKYLRL